jgi:hypothetical protein
VLFPEPFSPTMQNVSPRPDVERDIPKRPKVLVKSPAIEGDELLEAVLGIAVNRVTLRHLPKIDDVHGRSLL